jgi:hypothetical protein
VGKYNIQIYTSNTNHQEKIPGILTNKCKPPRPAAFFRRPCKPTNTELCPVVTGDDHLGRPGRHFELLVVNLITGRGSIRKEHKLKFMSLLHWPDPSLVIGIAPNFNQYIATKIQGIGHD